MPLTDPRAREMVGHAVCLTGTVRTGTTLVGTLLHSMRGVEYGFEPATLFMLFLLLDRMPDEAARLIYESYAFEELMLNGLAGRFMNLNPHDDSSILRAKSFAEVFGRFEKSGRFAELFDAGLNGTIAYKLPNIISRIPLLRNLYPDTRVVVMLRQPDPVAISMDRKGWYAGTLNHRDSRMLREVDGELVPVELPDSAVERWLKLSRFDRCYDFYRWEYQALLALPDALIINYESLMERPTEITTLLAERLGLEFGVKTAEIIGQIRERSPRNVVPEGVSKEIREEALEVHRQCARLAI